MDAGELDVGGKSRCLLKREIVFLHKAFGKGNGDFELSAPLVLSGQGGFER